MAKIIDPRKASISCNVCQDAGEPFVVQELGDDHGDGLHHTTDCFRVIACVGEQPQQVVMIPPAGPDESEQPLLVYVDLADPLCGVERHGCPESCYVRRSIELFNEHSATHRQEDHNAAALKRGFVVKS